MEGASVSDLNVPNRTLAITDNLPFLRSLNNKCIDLIAIDPPFAANETFTGRPRPPISVAEYAEEAALAAKHGAAHNEGIGETRVRDVWSWNADIHPGWKARISDDYPNAHAVIQAVEACASENEAAYICFMAIRLIECHRVLKPTGSIYVHCDNHANSYLRMVLDAIFGADNFRNEIVWCYTGPSNTPRWFPRKHDTILSYSRSNTFTFNRDAVRVPYSDSFTKRRQYSEGEQGITAGYSEGRTGDEIDVSFGKGKSIEDWWRDIPAGGQMSRNEITGYATQKPLALYERIIKASSNPGDVVLDIFAGCATTAIAAEKAGRQWIACDMAYRSATMLRRRFYLNGIQLSGTDKATQDALKGITKQQSRMTFVESKIIGPQELPARDDVDPEPYHHLQQSRRRGRQAGVQTASWSGRIPKDEAKDLLIKKFGPRCWGCGYEPWRPNGSLDLDLLEVDHIRARRAAAGTPGSDELYNLALLHRTCNRIKGNRLTLEEVRRYNADEKLLYVNTLGELVDLYEATQFAAEQIAAYDVRQVRQETSAV